MAKICLTARSTNRAEIFNFKSRS